MTLAQAHIAWSVLNKFSSCSQRRHWRLFEEQPLFLVLPLLVLPSTSFTLWSNLFVSLCLVCVCCQNKLSTISFFSCLPCRRLLLHCCLFLFEKTDYNLLYDLQAAPFTLSTIFLASSTIIHLGVWILQRLALLMIRIMTPLIMALLLIIRITTNEFCLHRFTDRRQDYVRIHWEIKTCEHLLYQSIQIWIICSES